MKIFKNKEFEQVMYSFMTYININKEEQEELLTAFKKGFNLKKSIDEKNKADKVRVLAESLINSVPSMRVHPSEMNLRSNINDVISSLKWFLKTYPEYTEDKIKKAVIAYGVRAEQEEGQFTSPLHYFIRKNNSSRLAGWCSAEPVAKKTNYSNQNTGLI